MTEDVAKRSIDWLHSTTCRVLALMGGEVLLRPDFAHKIVYYAAKRGFWVYVPTNGRLMKPDLIDRLADAGMATVNLAVDAWDVKPGLPKAMVPIRQYFDYLVRKQYKYGYSVFLNINICRNNLEDVAQLTELAHDNGIATDYHICETPLIEQRKLPAPGGQSGVHPRRGPSRDCELLDWLIDKQNSGWQMVNSTTRLAEMKSFICSASLEELGLPRRTEQPHHPRGRNACALLPDVLGHPRLGNHREPEDSTTAQLKSLKVSCESQLLLDPQSHPRLLLRQHARHQVAVAPGLARLPGRSRQHGLRSQPTGEVIRAERGGSLELRGGYAANDALRPRAPAQRPVRRSGAILSWRGRRLDDRQAGRLRAERQRSCSSSFTAAMRAVSWPLCWTRCAQLESALPITSGQHAPVRNRQRRRAHCGDSRRQVCAGGDGGQPGRGAPVIRRCAR